MTTASPALLKAKFAEFAAVDDAVVQTWLDDCALELNADRWGNVYADGLMLLAAHTMVRMGVLSGSAPSAAPPGQLASVTVGPVSKSFAVAGTGSSTENELMTTRYGQAFLRKRRTLVGTPFVV